LYNYLEVSKPRKISEITSIFGNLATTAQYQVVFGGLSFSLLNYLAIRGIDTRFIADTAGLLCSSGFIPTASYATSEIAGNCTGIVENIAHTKIYTPIELTFYVDAQYKLIKFFEHWSEFIASGNGNVDPTSPGYFHRMQYPGDYKCDSTKIFKFNKDYKHEIEYNFYGLFPKALSSPEIKYEDSQILTLTVQFAYERYLAGKTNSLNIKNNISNNIDGTITPQSNSFQQTIPPPQTSDFSADTSNTLKFNGPFL